MREIWKAVVGFEGSYEVSNLSRVRSLDRRVWHARGRGFWSRRKGVVLKFGFRPPDNYPVVALGREERTVAVHTLVLNAFISPRPVGKECRHLNGNSSNCCLYNLKWGTPSENAEDKRRHNSFSLTQANVRFIKRALAVGRRGVGVKLAIRFGVSDALISRIKCGLSYQDLVQ